MALILTMLLNYAGVTLVILKSLLSANIVDYDNVAVVDIVADVNSTADVVAADAVDDAVCK